MKIYLSEFHIDPQIKRHKNYKKAAKLVSLLEKQGFEIFHEPVWREYSQINNEIESCDCLLAIVDEYWQSSTWMAIELTHAQNLNMPTFIYYIPHDYHHEVPRNNKVPNFYELPSCKYFAVKFTKKVMKKHNSK